MARAMRRLYSQYAPNDVLFKAMTNFTPTQFQNLLAKLMDPAMPRATFTSPLILVAAVGWLGGGELAVGAHIN